MRIGKQDAPFTAICTSDATSITVRGRDLTSEIVGKMDFTAYFWLLVTGTEPNEEQSFFLNAVLCSLADLPDMLTMLDVGISAYRVEREALLGPVLGHLC